MAKFDPAQEITNQIIAAMEAGTPPWRKPWTGQGAPVGFPRRANGEPYRGINVLMLWLPAFEKGYSSPYWFAFRQAKELGARVRKGESSTMIVKYGTIERDNDQGEAETIPYLKAYRVFNAGQIDGLPEAFCAKVDPPRDLGTEVDPDLRAWFEATGGRVRLGAENPVKDLELVFSSNDIRLLG